MAILQTMKKMGGQCNASLEKYVGKMGWPFHFKASDTCGFSAIEIPFGIQQIPRHWVSEINAFAE
jgi:hypothetical protein